MDYIARGGVRALDGISKSARSRALLPFLPDNLGVGRALQVARDNRGDIGAAAAAARKMENPKVRFSVAYAHSRVLFSFVLRRLGDLLPHLFFTRAFRI